MEAVLPTQANLPSNLLIISMYSLPERGGGQSKRSAPLPRLWRRVVMVTGAGETKILVVS